MTRMKPVLWALFGVAVGMSAATFGSPVSARVSQADYRVMTTTIVPNAFGAELYFLKDKRSGGCWLLTRGEGTTSLAVAPASACD